MARLSTLPEELLLQILEFVPQEAILNLNIVSKQLHRLTLDRLYNTVSGHPLLFLRTIAIPPPLGRADLAKRVKHLVYFARVRDSTQFEHDLNSNRIAIANTFRHLKLAVPEASVDGCPGPSFIGPPDNYFELRPWFCDLMISFLPNMETLEIHIPQRWYLRSFYFTTIAANSTRFMHLKQAALHGPLTLYNILPIFQVSSLKSLDLWEVEYTDYDNTIPFDLIVSCKLQHLGICNSYVPTTQVVHLLNALQPLHSFTYEHKSRHSFRDLYGMNRPSLDHALLAGSLSRHTPALTSLHLHDCNDQLMYQTGWYDWPSSHIESLSLSPFRDSTSQIPTWGLTEASVMNGIQYWMLRLPRTLRSMSITLEEEFLAKFDKWGGEEIKGFLIRKLAAEFAALGLRVLRIKTGGKWRGLDIEGVKWEFSEAGIKFECGCVCEREDCECGVGEDGPDDESVHSVCIHCGDYPCQCE